MRVVKQAAGVIGPGGIQWMRAGKGIVHSEMPEQEQGLMRGFQLWINLPASEKMTAPKYQEFDAKQIPLVSLANGARIKVIAGEVGDGAESTKIGVVVIKDKDTGQQQRSKAVNHHVVASRR